LAVVAPPAAAALDRREQRLDPRPGLVSQFAAPHLDMIADRKSGPFTGHALVRERTSAVGQTSATSPVQVVNVVPQPCAWLPTSALSGVAAQALKASSLCQNELGGEVRRAALRVTELEAD